MTVTFNKLLNLIDLNVIVIFFIITCNVADYDTDEDSHERAQ